jgi:hypothetical protein
MSPLTPRDTFFPFVDPASAKTPLKLLRGDTPGCGGDGSVCSDFASQLSVAGEGPGGVVATADSSTYHRVGQGRNNRQVNEMDKQQQHKTD